MNTNTNSSKHVILLAHGSRDGRWCKTFESGLEAMRPGLANATSLAYMEMAEPTLEFVVGREYDRGARDFSIVPLFLAAGKHLLVDVPLQVESLRDAFRDIEITLHDAIGTDRAFWEFLVPVLNDKTGQRVAGNLST